MTSDTPAACRDPIALLHRVWDARAVGDLSVLEEALAPDAKWRGIDDGPWSCENRADIMRVLRQNLAHGLDGRIDETIPYGERIMVAFRPSEVWHSDRPLDDGIAYVVITVHDGAITEMKGCATRASAEDYATTGRTSAPHVNRVRPPDSVTSPPPLRFSRLIPFVHVTDVERSIAWYRHLGFVVTEIFTPGGRLNWANLVSGDAELMLQRAFGRVTDPGAIVLWLYSHDLAALRDQLVAAGVSAGEIVDGTPGPRQQMELTDPDGYTVMVAQIEDE
jgi:catechol 2,3-dioxygenase-like lactoylglutathione lyase family enzyme/ketosteroid isomerase-like protein